MKERGRCKGWCAGGHSRDKPGHGQRAKGDRGAAGAIAERAGSPGARELTQGRPAIDDHQGRGETGAYAATEERGVIDELAAAPGRARRVAGARPPSLAARGPLPHRIAPDPAVRTCRSCSTTRRPGCDRPGPRAARGLRKRDGSARRRRARGRRLDWPLERRSPRCARKCGVREREIAPTPSASPPRRADTRGG